MADLIKFKKGLAINVPALNLAEPGFFTDAGAERLVIGGTQGNVLLPNMQDIKNISEIAHGAVADLAELKAIDTTNISDNITIIVKSLGFYRFDSASTLTVDDSAVVQPTVGPGRWINDLLSHKADIGAHGSDFARNAIINGNFDIWQRGASFVNPADNSYTADRFALYKSNLGENFPNITISQEKIIPGELLNSNSFYRINVDGSGNSFVPNSYYQIGQHIENGVRSLCGLNKKLTLSFYARSSIPTKQIGIYMEQNYGSGGSPSASEIIKGANLNLTSSWQKFSYTFTTNTLNGKTIGTNKDDRVIIFFVPVMCSGLSTGRLDNPITDFGGAGNIDIAQVKLEAGDVTTPFSPRTYIDEYLKCARYCYAIDGNTFYRAGTYWSDGLTYSIPTPTRMRVTPSLVFGTEGIDWHIQNVSGVNQTGFSANITSGASTITLQAIKTSHGLTDGTLNILTWNKNFLDAEL